MKQTFTELMVWQEEDFSFIITKLWEILQEYEFNLIR